MASTLMRTVNGTWLNRSSDVPSIVASAAQPTRSVRETPPQCLCEHPSTRPPPLKGEGEQDNCSLSFQGRGPGGGVKHPPSGFLPKCHGDPSRLAGFFPDRSDQGQPALDGPFAALEPGG